MQLVRYILVLALAGATAPLCAQSVLGLQPSDPALHGGTLPRPNSAEDHYRHDMLAPRKQLLAAIAENGGVLSDADRTAFQARIDALQARYRAAE